MDDVFRDLKRIKKYAVSHVLYRFSFFPRFAPHFWRTLPSCENVVEIKHYGQTFWSCVPESHRWNLTRSPYIAGNRRGLLGFRTRFRRVRVSSVFGFVFSFFFLPMFYFRFGFFSATHYQQQQRDCHHTLNDVHGRKTGSCSCSNGNATQKRAVEQ